MAVVTISQTGPESPARVYLPVRGFMLAFLLVILALLISFIPRAAASGKKAATPLVVSVTVTESLAVNADGSASADTPVMVIKRSNPAVVTYVVLD